MILNENLVTLISRVSQLERKEEDKIKWQSAYLEILEKGYLTIEIDNIEKCISNMVVDSPLTPLGNIILIKHIKRTNIDLRQLAKTTEIAVRLLDGCLDIINFTKEAKNKVSKFRKIGISVADFENYCIVVVQEQQDAVYEIGEIISKTAYRTSEQLAIERGGIENLEEAKPYNRGKIFSLYTSNIRDIKKDKLNGYEIKNAQFDISDYYQIPRRNSHILLFSNQEIWFPFSDRVEGDHVFQEQSKFIDSIELGMGVGREGREPVTQYKYNAKFNIGELVKVITEGKTQFGRIYQVINCRLIVDRFIYSLKGPSVSTNQTFDEEELEVIDLNYALQKMNNKDPKDPKTEPKISTGSYYKIICVGVIQNLTETAIIVGNDLQLPQVTLVNGDVTPETNLVNHLDTNYGLKSEILDEIGTIKKDNIIYIAFWLNILNINVLESLKPEEKVLTWQNIDNLDLSTPINQSIETILTKLNRKKRIYKQYEKIILSLEKEKESFQSQIREQKNNPILLLQEKSRPASKWHEKLYNLLTNQPKKEYLRIEEKKNLTKKLNGYGETQLHEQQADFEYNDQKYLLSLQQNIISSDFGLIKVIMEYSKSGIKSLQMYPEKFKADERFLLDLYLEVINLGLQKGVSKEEFTTLLFKYEKSLEPTSLLDIVKVVRQCLSQAPNNFNDLSQKIY